MKRYNQSEKLLKLDENLASLRTLTNDQKIEINNLKISSNTLSEKNSELINLLEMVMGETLQGIDLILSNAKRGLLAIAGAKKGLNSSLSCKKNESDVDLNSNISNERREFIELGAALGANNEHKKFLERFILEIEGSIREGMTSF